jgi:Tfp pilus assembly protein FimT
MKPKGFTLIEAVISVSLVGLMIYAGSISFQALVPKFQLQTGLWSITSGLNQARFRAIWAGTRVQIKFNSSGYTCEHFDEADEVWRVVRSAVLPGVVIHANNAPVFHPAGTVSNLASIFVSNKRGAYRITIAITGRIKTAKLE